MSQVRRNHFTMMEAKRAFVKRKKNREILKEIHNIEYRAGAWKTPVIKRLLIRARAEIGYSDKTIDMDILNSLYRTSRSM